MHILGRTGSGVSQAELTYISSIATSGGQHQCLTRYGNYIYAQKSSIHTCFLDIVNITNRTSPVYLGQYSQDPGTTIGNAAVATNGPFLYTARYSAAGIGVLDVTIGNAPVFVRNVSTPATSANMIGTYQGYIFAGRGRTGLATHTLLNGTIDPSNPSVITTYSDTGVGRVSGVTVAGNPCFAYIETSGLTGKMSVINMSGLLVSSVNNAWGNSISRIGNLDEWVAVNAYYASPKKMITIDISAPGAIIYNQFNNGDPLFPFPLANDLGIANYSAGTVASYNGDDPSSISFVNQAGSCAQAFDSVVVDDEYVYVMGLNGQIHTLTYN
jgi:hypothetical protein